MRKFTNLAAIVFGVALVFLGVGVSHATGISGVPANPKFQTVTLYDSLAALKRWRVDYDASDSIDFDYSIGGAYGDRFRFRNDGAFISTSSIWLDPNLNDTGWKFSVENPVTSLTFRKGATSYFKFSPNSSGLEILGSSGLYVAGVTTLAGGISGSLTSTKACATNFVRVTPNYCHATTDVGSGHLSWATVVLSRDVCTAVAAPSVEARVIVVRTVATARSANAIAGRATAIEQHGTSACSGSLGDLSNASGYEFSAIPAIVPLATDVSLIAIRPQAGAGGSIYLKMIDDAGNGGSASYAIVGYYD